MQDEVTFCIKWIYAEDKERVQQRLVLYTAVVFVRTFLVHLLTHDIIPIVSEQNTLAPVVGKQTILALRFAEYLALGHLQSTLYQKG